MKERTARPFHAARWPAPNMMLSFARRVLPRRAGARGLAALSDACIGDHNAPLLDAHPARLHPRLAELAARRDVVPLRRPGRAR